jgi:hypothetical protein
MSINSSKTRRCEICLFSQPTEYPDLVECHFTLTTEKCPRIKNIPWPKINNWDWCKHFEPKLSTTTGNQ